MKTILNAYDNFLGFVALLGLVADEIRLHFFRYVESDLLYETQNYVRRCLLYTFIVSCIMSALLFEVYQLQISEELVPLLGGFVINHFLPTLCVLIIILRIGLRNTSVVMQLEHIRYNFKMHGHTYAKLDSDKAFIREITRSVIASVICAILIYCIATISFQIVFGLLLMLNNEGFVDSSLLLKQTSNIAFVISAIKLAIITLFTSIVALYHGVCHIKFSRAISLSVADQVAAAILLQCLLLLL